MTTSVTIAAEAWSDVRFVRLALRAPQYGLRFADAHHALIACARLWAWQTLHWTPDAPTYVVSRDVLGELFAPYAPGGRESADPAAVLIAVRLAEDHPDGVRIRGGIGRIERLYLRRQYSARGGESTKRKHDNNSGPTGSDPGSR